MDRHERELLLADLRHSDDEMRRLAVERLSLLSPSEAMPFLIDSLGDPSWRVRKAAVERLVALPDAAVPVLALVPALADGENPGRRNAALEALTRLGAAAAPALIDASHDSDADVRKQATDALAVIAAPSALERLIELLEDSDPNVRGSAAEALGAIGDETAVQALAERVEQDDEVLVRLAALRSLVRLRASLPIARLSAPLSAPLLRPAALQLLGFCEEPEAFDILHKALAGPARSVREAAMEAFVCRIGLAPPGEEGPLIERLRAATPELPFLSDVLSRLADAPLTTRLVLVQFLGCLGRADCVVPLLEAARDEALVEVVLGVLAPLGATAERALADAWPSLTGGVRLQACALLGRTRGEAGTALLVRALDREDPVLRSVAAASLAERGSQSALPMLVAALRSAAQVAEREGDPEAWAPLESAIAALVARADAATGDRVAALLEQGLEGAAEGYRHAAARLLGQIGNARQLAPVELLLTDPSPAVRRAAVGALVAVAPNRLDLLRCALADEAAQVRAGAAAALAATGDEGAAADLASLLDDPEPRVAAAGLRGLATWAKSTESAQARERALLPLSVGLAHGGTTALAALDALAALGGEDVVALAHGATASPDLEIAEAAVACVGLHGQRHDLARLLPALAHDAWPVRARVAQVMAERHHVHAIPSLIQRLEVEADEFVRGVILSSLATLESD